MIRYLFLALLISTPGFAADVIVDGSNWTQVQQASSPVAEAAANAVRVVFPMNGVSGSGQAGSGVYLGDKYILTAWHVPEGTPGTGTVYFRDGTQIKCKINAADKRWDMCVLTMESEHPTLPGVEFADDNPRLGETIYSAGFGAGFRIFGGRVTSFGAANGASTNDWVNHQNPAVSGDSGGPIFTQAGRLIGPLWGKGQGQTIGTSTGRAKTFCGPLLPGLAKWRAGRIFGRGGQPPVCPPGTICPIPGAPGGGGQTPVPNPQPPVEQPPARTPPPAANDCNCEELIKALIEKIKVAPALKGPKGDRGPQGEAGPVGPAGPKGEKGDPGQVTDEQLAAIITAVVQNVKSDPAMRGPQGEPGKDAVIDLDALAAEVAAKMPGQRVLLVDGKSGKVIDDETYKLGEPIVLDVQTIVNAAAKKK